MRESSTNYNALQFSPQVCNELQVFMAIEFTRAQIQEAIEAIERFKPGTWQRMIDYQRGMYADKETDEQLEVTRGALYVMAKAFEALSFVRDSADRDRTESDLMVALWNATGDEINKLANR